MHIVVQHLHTSSEKSRLVGAWTFMFTSSVVRTALSFQSRVCRNDGSMMSGWAGPPTRGRVARAKNRSWQQILIACRKQNGYKDYIITHTDPLHRH